MNGSIKMNQGVFWQLLPKLGDEQGGIAVLKTDPTGMQLLADS